MIRASTAIFLAILLFAISTKAQQQDGSVFERRVTILQENQPLGYILEQLSWKAGVYFSYDASIVNAEQKHSIDVENKSLFNVLRLLFDNDMFRFSELENQIIISEKKNEEKTTSLDSIKVNYFFLNGKITESKKGKPIKYASVSILNKPIGTITNQEGEFLLKIHPDRILDTIVISCMGYKQLVMPANHILDETQFVMDPISIRIRTVKVTSTTPERLLANIRENRDRNYSNDNKLMTAFYRETIKQDGEYISISEAVMEILKAPYDQFLKNDVVRLKKGRKNPDVKPFQWINFKLQGGPFNITKLDVVKMTEQFIDPEFEWLYKYKIERVIWYRNHPAYVLSFQSLTGTPFPAFSGEIFVHRETFAILHAEFSLSRSELHEAEKILIKKKPRGVRARPTAVNYSVNYKQYQGKWHLYTARAAINIRIRSKRDRLNAEFTSVSDLLITNIESTELKRFNRNEEFKKNQIFVEVIDISDQKFWENYNIIKPDEDLVSAFKKDLQ